MSEKTKKLILEKRKEGKLVVATHEGFMSVDIKEFIKQPVDGILYDLNRLEEVSLTFIDDPKWVNDFAVALTIRELYAENVKLKEYVAQLESCDLCDERAEYRQCQKCMNNKLIGSHTDEEYEALQKQVEGLLERIHGDRVYKRRNRQIMCGVCFTLRDVETHTIDCILAKFGKVLEAGGE